jgi:hypothetical protein
LKVLLHVEGDADAVGATRSLFRWLVNDPDVARLAEVRPSGRIEPGEMGPGLDMIDVVVSNSIGLASLVTAVATWRLTRSRGTEVRIESAGRVVTVMGDDQESVRRVVAALSAGVPGPKPAAEEVPFRDSKGKAQG